VAVLARVVEGFQLEAINGVICTPPGDDEYGFPLWDAPPSRLWCAPCQQRWARLFALPAEFDAAIKPLALHETPPPATEVKETKVNAYRFETLRRLPENWDSYGAARLDPAVIDRAQLFLARVSVVPCSDGAVQLEWHTHGLDLEIEFTPEGKTEVYASAASDEAEILTDGAQLQAAQETIATLTAERDEARLDVTRMAQTKVGQKCAHHLDSLVTLEFLALRECPICWMSAAQNSEALYRAEKVKAEAAEAEVATLRAERDASKFAGRRDEQTSRTSPTLTGEAAGFRTASGNVVHYDINDHYDICPQCGVMKPCLAHPDPTAIQEDGGDR
jgi:hypothetical protein